MKNVKILSVALATTFLLSGCGVKVVSTGERGVKTEFGKIISDSLPEGMYFYNPFTQSMVSMDTKTIKQDGKTESYTKDVQRSDLDYTVTYHLDPTKAHVMFQTVGEGWEDKLIPQTVSGAIKGVIGKWEAVSLVENRQKATTEILKTLQEELSEKNIVVDGFELTNIAYAPEFEKAVEAKVTAIQQASEAENHTKQIQEEAKQQVITAEAEAKAMQIKSDALSKNQSLVAYEAVQKWDGVLPIYNIGGGATPFISLPDVQK